MRFKKWVAKRDSAPGAMSATASLPLLPAPVALPHCSPAAQVTTALHSATLGTNTRTIPLSHSSYFFFCRASQSGVSFICNYCAIAKADKLPPRFHPAANTITAIPAACSSKHSNIMIMVYLIFGFAKYGTKNNNCNLK